MSRQSELAQIHIARKDLGMEDDAYRALLLDVAKVDSSAQLDFAGRHAVIHRMKQLGWKPKRKPRKTGPTARTRKKSLGDKIRALWIELYDLGIVRDKSEAALMSYIKRMTHGKYQAPQFCDQSAAIMVVEALKKWKTRELDKRDKEEQPSA